MANQVFLLPDLGEGLTEAVIVKWLVAVGDTVATDQAVAEVETAKSIVELPTPFAGTITALHGAEGESVDTGAPIIEVEDGTEGAAAPAAPAAGTDAGAEAEKYREEERAGSGSGNVLIGYGTSEGGRSGRRRRKGAAREGAHAAAPAAAAPAAPAAPAAAAPATGPVAVRSPIVRRLARELGVDVRSIAATGADGAVTRADVLAAAEGGSAAGAASQAAATAQPTGVAADGMHGLSIVEQERMSPLRKMVASKLATSRREIPEATVWVDVDFTELWNLRPRMAAEGERPPSIATIVARYALKALEEYPLMASRLSDDGNEIIRYDGVNLGIAVDSERGLTVPVLPRADRMTIAELDAALRELSAEARTGRIAPQRLAGSTFTLNNYGGLGTDGSTPIINHPEVAMVGMGRIIERPWVVKGEIVARRIGTVVLAFDHRICDGGYASGFLNKIVGLIENPLLAYSEL